MRNLPPCCRAKYAGKLIEGILKPFLSSPIPEFIGVGVEIGYNALSNTGFKVVGGLSAIWGYFYTQSKTNNDLVPHKIFALSIDELPKNDTTEFSAYKPFATSFTELPESVTIYENVTKFRGSGTNILIKASSKGSEIFVEGGPSYIIAGSGIDKIYSSKCSRDIIDRKINTIVEGFDPSQDKLYWFCTKAPVFPENITIVDDTINSINVTSVYVRGDIKNSAITLKYADINNNEQTCNEELTSNMKPNIFLNEKWPYGPAGVIEYENTEI